MNEAVTQDLTHGVFTDAGEAVTYRRTTAKVLDASTGVVTPTTADTSVTAVRRSLTLIQAERVGGLVEHKDVPFLFVHDDLDFLPGDDDIIIDAAGKQYAVVTYELLAHGALLKIYSRPIA